MKIQEDSIDQALGTISEILSPKQKKRGLLIHAFHQIQKEHNYLPEEELKKLSRTLDVPLTDVYSTATFYKQFYFKPRGRNVVSVCTGTACHVRGAGEILADFKTAFGVDEGETTGDMSLTLETVGCVGCCGLAPVVTVNEEVVGEVDGEKFNELASRIRSAK
ncbi:MAG: NAD(P)H-dependent oxidoreductase subunit E [Nitrospirota bacterium]|jgi:NADH:ubiquinone oxidoreductase subunit E